MPKQRFSLLYKLLTALGLMVTALAVARAAGWLGVVERLTVTLTTAERRDIEAVVSAHGTIQAAQAVTIRSELSGEVVRLPVAEGDTVEAGQLLAVIHLSGGLANLNQTRAQADRQRAKWAEAQARTSRLRILQQQAEANYQRNRFLHRRGVTADAAWEQQQANYHTDRQAARAARHQAEAAYHKVKEAQANVQQATQQQALTQLHAPRRGTVVRRYVAAGERVVGTNVQDGTALLQLATLDQLEAHFTVDETEVLSIAEGQRAQVRLAALPGWVITGRVTHVAYRPVSGGAPGGSMYPVRVALDTTASLRVGMTAEVDIVTQTRQQVLTVPLLAVSPRPNPNPVSEADSLLEVVFVHERGTVAQRTVTTGIHNRDYIEITDGIEADETVVSGPYRAVFHQLRDNQPVRSDPDQPHPSRRLARVP